jgi:hypothetical protein
VLDGLPGVVLLLRVTPPLYQIQDPAGSQPLSGRDSTLSRIYSTS